MMSNKQVELIIGQRIHNTFCFTREFSSVQVKEFTLLRNKGYEPFTIIGEIYDKIYPDEFLKKVYTNMKFIK